MRHLAILLVALVAGQALAGTIKSVSVTVKLGEAGSERVSRVRFRQLDDKMTLRDLGETALEMLNLEDKEVHAMLESHERTSYDLDKSLKVNQIGDKSALECWARELV